MVLLGLRLLSFTLPENSQLERPVIDARTFCMLGVPVSCTTELQSFPDMSSPYFINIYSL